MAEPFADLAELDRLVHEPARLAILTALSVCQSADFRYLERLTGLTRGNLSSHLTKLEAAGLVSMEKTFAGKTPRTVLSLTKQGNQAIEQHWMRLQQLHEDAKRWGATSPEVAPT